MSNEPGMLLLASVQHDTRTHRERHIHDDELWRALARLACATVSEKYCMKVSMVRDIVYEDTSTTHAKEEPNGRGWWGRGAGMTQAPTLYSGRSIDIYQHSLMMQADLLHSQDGRGVPKAGPRQLDGDTITSTARAHCSYSQQL
eukprot:5467084-Pyramimonas_sp.AAC.1